MVRGVLNRLRRLLPKGKTAGKQVRGVDAGRETFFRTAQQEQRLKKNLLKRLNAYRKSKQLASQGSYTASQKKPEKLRFLVLAGCLAAVLAVFITGRGPGGLLGLLESIEYFRLTSIDVQGCRRVPVQQIRSASGVTVSDSLVTLDLVPIAAAVRAINPWVKEVDVSRDWPNTLVIRINEYEPYALLALDGQNHSELHYLDRDGVAFVKTDTGMDLDYPVVTGVEKTADNERMEQLQETLSFLHLVSANNPNLPVQSVSEVHIDPEEGIIVYLVEHPFPIFLGSGEIRQKYLRLRKVLEVLYKPRKTGMDIARVAYIRMNYLQDKVIVGYKES